MLSFTLKSSKHDFLSNIEAFLSSSTKVIEFVLGFFVFLGLFDHQFVK